MTRDNVAVGHATLLPIDTMKHTRRDDIRYHAPTWQTLLRQRTIRQKKIITPSYTTSPRYHTLEHVNGLTDWITMV